MGVIVHFLGILGDSSFAARVYVKKHNCYRLTSLILVSLYTILWLGWLIWLHVVVFNHEGKVCAGAYLEDSDGVIALDGYAIKQASVLKSLIIAIWCINGGITVLSIIAGIIAARYLKSKRGD